MNLKNKKFIIVSLMCLFLVCISVLTLYKAFKYYNIWPFASKTELIENISIKNSEKERQENDKLEKQKLNKEREEKQKTFKEAILSLQECYKDQLESDPEYIRSKTRRTTGALEIAATAHPTYINAYRDYLRNKPESACVVCGVSDEASEKLADIEKNIRTLLEINMKQGTLMNFYESVNFN